VAIRKPIRLWWRSFWPHWRRFGARKRPRPDTGAPLGGGQHPAPVGPLAQLLPESVHCAVCGPRALTSDPATTARAHNAATGHPTAYLPAALAHESPQPRPNALPVLRQPDRRHNAPHWMWLTPDLTGPLAAFGIDHRPRNRQAS
jgi:hypothetical protein